MSIKLTDTQLVMLSAAAQRDDRCLMAPQSQKRSAAEKVVAKLLRAGLVKEIKAQPGMSIWRRDEETARSYAIKLTAAGLKAIAVDERESEVANEPANEPRRARAAPSARKTASVQVKSRPETYPAAQAQNDVVEPARNVGAKANPALAATAPRRGSKLADVLAMLGRKDGATIEELILATDWLAHTTRAALTGLRKRGFQIERRRDEKVTRYWVAGLKSNEAAASESMSSAERSNVTEESNAAGRTVALVASASVGAASSPTNAA